MWQLPKLSSQDILIYLRKSRTDDPTLTVEEVLSKHEQMLNEWVERNLPGNSPISEENRYREVVSGETIESRPKVRDLLRRIESPRIKAVLIVEPQRLSRGDLEDIGHLVKILRYTNTLVITLQYSYDLNDERDRDLFERELKRGNEFLEYQKRIMGNGRLLSVAETAEGWTVTAPAPEDPSVQYDEGHSREFAGLEEMRYWDLRDAESNGGNHIVDLAPGESVTIQMGFLVSECQLGDLWFQMNEGDVDGFVIHTGYVPVP